MADKLTVNIQNEDMKLDFFFSPSDSILQVKKSVEDLVEWEVETQSLFYNGEELKNDRTLESYNLTEGAYVEFDLIRKTGESSQPQPEPKFNVRVKSRYNEEGVIRVRRGYLVSHLKNKIGRKWGFLGPDISLYHNDVEMRDFYNLSHYNISESSVIKLELKMDLKENVKEDVKKVKEEDMAIPYPSQHGR
ncbi:hypothetical protein JCGZ_22489 [Jatropha curcas]|uniref:Ubiquitin-like domain-containing protein n=1 Tax=Jatropha curcas TaxID=180498 RepID=A0A067JTZ4_JATCU|nr:hypothetical protein JCGZ_22489 [Jatropha curcas]